MKDMMNEMHPSRVHLVFSTKALDTHMFDFFRPPGAIPVSTGLRRTAEDNVITIPEGEIGLFDETKVKTLTVELELLLKYLKDFKVEQIELWISGVAETKGVLSLAIAAKGEGGVRVVLKPRV